METARLLFEWLTSHTDAYTSKKISLSFGKKSISQMVTVHFSQIHVFQTKHHEVSEKGLTYSISGFTFKQTVFFSPSSVFSSAFEKNVAFSFWHEALLSSPACRINLSSPLHWSQWVSTGKNTSILSIIICVSLIYAPAGTAALLRSWSNTHYQLPYIFLLFLPAQYSYHTRSLSGWKLLGKQVGKL